MFEFLGIYWAGASKIYLLPLFVAAIFFVIKNYVRVKNASSLLVHPKHQNVVFKFFSLRKQLLKAICLSTALGLIFLALLQPQWGKKEFNVMQEGRDLIIALDISRSMLAKDLKPSRLEFTKLKIRNLLDKLDFERVGLILFSGTAFMQCPLTVDHAAFLMFLDQVDVETIASGTTAIDSAILKAVEIFSQNENRKNKLLLIATDGQDYSLNLNHVKNKAKQENIKLFALGTATVDGAPIPKIDAQGNQAGHELDSDGNIAITKLDESMLEKICTDLDGRYLRASYDDRDLHALVKLIKSYEKEKFEDKKLSYYQDQYPWLLGLAFIFLALEWVL